jgi:hypothetical protein
MQTWHRSYDKYYSIKHHVYIGRYKGVWEDEPLYNRRSWWWRQQWRWRRWAARGAGGGGAGGSAGDSPTAGIMGERCPLAPFLHGFMGALPHGDGIHGGRRKRGSGGCKFVGGSVPHELGFLPLYSLSDSHLPILGRTRSDLIWLSGLGIRWIFYPERLPWNSLQLCSWRVFRLTLYLTGNVTIFEKSSSTDFWKVPIWLQQDFHLYSW